MCPAPPALPEVFVPPAVNLFPPTAPPSAYWSSNDERPPFPAADEEVAAAPPAPTFTTIDAPGMTV